MLLLNILFESLSNYEFVDVSGFESDDFDVELQNGETVLASDLVSELESVFSDAKIRIMSSENPYELVIDKDGKVVGGSVISYDLPADDEYDSGVRSYLTFSVAVDPAARGQGIAAKLTKNIMKRKRHDIIIRAQVVNPYMEQLLIKLGFQKTHESGSAEGLVYELA